MGVILGGDLRVLPHKNLWDVRYILGNIIYPVAQWLGICLFLTVMNQATAATSLPETASTFDHIVTGFLLDGEHALLECETCHKGGVFEELPTNCSNCHDGVFAVGQSPNHIPTTQPCESCHTPSGFTVATLALFDHSTIGTQSCISCHDGIAATGKGPTHILSSDRCNACHSVTTWIPTTFVDHAEITGSCVSCHDGVIATGKTPTHINSTDVCDACHGVSVWVPVLI